MSMKRIMIIAGEASGDMHGAHLARAIKQRDDKTFLFGVGGKAMAREGVSLLVDADTLSVVGITEVLTRLKTIYGAMSTVKKAIARLSPDLLICIDFPDFNFHVAAAAKRRNIPVLYYISPQIWAWRQNRVKKIKRLVDHMAVIFPFEAKFYEEHHVPVTFVGHPFLDIISPPTDETPGTDETAITIGLVPGSREKEVTTLLPVMLKAAKIINRMGPAVRFVVSCAQSVDETLVSDIVTSFNTELPIEVINGPVTGVFKKCRLVVAASGTVTLEAALHGVVPVIVYKVSPMSYWLGKRLIKVRHIGIVNLIVQRELLPELIQDEASPEKIADTVHSVISDPQRLQETRKEMLRIRELLGGPGASDRVARIALHLCKGKDAGQDRNKKNAPDGYIRGILARAFKKG